MLTSTSSNPAIQAYKVYHLSQTKLDRECRRQTPDLHRIVLHASIVDNVRRWSRDLATPSETVMVDSESDTDSDPFEDSASDEEYEDATHVDQVAIFDCEVDDDTTIEQQSQSNGKVYAVQSGMVQPVANKDSQSKSAPASPRRRAPPPPSAAKSTYELNDQSWKQNRPVTVRETAIEVDGDD
ncbi:uncharacterized protein Z519_08569 [Cladophialophora bantiana CBS 173.52]|uniref:Uncharacterized protein n=1 Tax=Cladophialophora bantiana (strain ATCC 10958 / CBS 173.52 / CDC B-1940 / NIH 8579) TaxID=1442370 RepID=A0A0D2EL97_CLAB1|nr:uncharacterized protein Z519_08569 [Cladophialophora bantiana CBS 173.52]KIW90786.1 hypothetical protein Z519_08569 [Cladophialophora bantiana CBS 173.52]